MVLFYYIFNCRMIYYRNTVRFWRWVNSKLIRSPIKPGRLYTLSSTVVYGTPKKHKKGAEFSLFTRCNRHTFWVLTLIISYFPRVVIRILAENTNHLSLTFYLIWPWRPLPTSQTISVHPACLPPLMEAPVPLALPRIPAPAAIIP